MFKTVLFLLLFLLTCATADRRIRRVKSLSEWIVIFQVARKNAQNKTIKNHPASLIFNNKSESIENKSTIFILHQAALKSNKKSPSVGSKVTLYRTLSGLWGEVVIKWTPCLWSMFQLIFFPTTTSLKNPRHWYFVRIMFFFWIIVKSSSLDIFKVEFV